jgi:hypothetical protein
MFRRVLKALGRKLAEHSLIFRHALVAKQAETVRRLCSYEGATPEALYDIMRTVQGLPEELVNEIRQEVARMGGPLTESRLALDNALRHDPHNS